MATAAEMLSTEGAREATEVLRFSTTKIEKTGYDNWDGGIATWIVYLQIEPAFYERLGAKRQIIQDQITSRLKSILQPFTNDWYSVAITPKVESRPNWRESVGEVSRAARRNILDGLKPEGVSWSGRLDDVEFLERLYDLETLPSYDSRFENAAGDIWQHRVNNPDDWPDDWVFADSRFQLLTGPSSLFLRFLCEVIHPVVRPDKLEALRLVQHFNDQLRADGWKIVEEDRIAGRSRFVAQPILVSHRSVSRARTVADALDAGWMQKEIERLEKAVETDPALAIGTAKELVESCCKTILSKQGTVHSKHADLPELTKLLAKELQLVPDDVSDKAKGSETIRLILRNLSALTQYLAELRGLYGSGHGRDGKHRGLKPRHARLAVGAAVAFIDFVTETYHERVTKNEDHSKK